MLRLQEASEEDRIINQLRFWLFAGLAIMCIASTPVSFAEEKGAPIIDRQAEELVKQLQKEWILEMAKGRESDGTKLDGLENKINEIRKLQGKKDALANAIIRQRQKDDNVNAQQNLIKIDKINTMLREAITRARVLLGLPPISGVGVGTAAGIGDVKLLSPATPGLSVDPIIISPTVPKTAPQTITPPASSAGPGGGAETGSVAQ